ncbi:uncharacterized protein LOC134726427 [Mytilus trossulus]|uniref:uncharacterized protein LOC134726427 n=1 Tax=Mytilus trossulus TaxID=6551 RepID=UPI003007C2B0
MRIRDYVLVCVIVLTLLKVNGLYEIPGNYSMLSLNRTLDRRILIDTSADMPTPQYNDTEFHTPYISSFENHAGIQYPSSYIFIDSLGNHYSRFLYHIFEMWDMELDNLAIITDQSGAED